MGGDDTAPGRPPVDDRYRWLFEATSDAILLADDRGTFVDANAAAASLLGMPRATIVGMNIGALIPVEGPDATTRYEAYVRTGHEAGEFHFRRLDGEVRLARYRASRIGPDLHQSVLRDVTEERAAELARRALEVQLQQAHQRAQKMEVVGRTAGGLAHDFNNLLQAILGATDRTLRSGTLAPEVAADLEEIARAGQRASELTRQLLAFAGQRIVAPSRIAPNQLLGSLEHVLRSVAGAGCTLHLHLTEPLPSVQVEPTQIELVLVNLVANARDAVERAGTVTITSGARTVAADAPELAAGSYVTITVGDAGPGFSADALTHLFEPFFSTKGPRVGSGLGLASAYGILRAHGGALTVDTGPRGGAMVTLHLPAAPDAPAPRARDVAAEAKAQPGPGGIEAILLVEDDDVSRRTLGRSLKALGYQVHQACDGVDALALLEGPGAPTIDIVITDVLMPRLGGRALADRIAERWPAIPVLFISGYTRDQVRPDDVARPGRAFLQKPFTPAELARTVRHMLDARAATAVS